METLNCNHPLCLKGTDSETIAATLKKAVEDGINTVVIPRYNKRTGRSQWDIEKAVVIPSGMTLILDNCTLVQAVGCYDHMFTAEKGAKGIRIQGEGNVTLSGGEGNRLQETTSGKYGLPEITVNTMLHFEEVTDICIDNLHIEKQRWAALYFSHCQNIRISHLDYFNVPHLPNLYGMLFGHGCSHVEIEDITGRSGASTVYIRANELEKPSESTDVYDFTIKTVNVDPARGSLVQFNVSGGHKVHDFEMETLFDSSDFYEKKRSASIIGIGSTAYRPVVRAKKGDIYNLHMKGAISRSTVAICICDSMKDCKFEQMMTFGDIITAVAVQKSDTELENIVFDRFYHGQGSEPNNSNSFISLQARGQLPINMEKATGTYEFTHFYLPDEEEAK